jgi:hypothetical protein
MIRQRPARLRRDVPPQLALFRFALGYLAGEAAFGAGVYSGAAAERTAVPLMPRLAWRPPQQAPALAVRAAGKTNPRKDHR